jgi:inhibitor of KinA
VRFFDPKSPKGALLGPGDALKFHPVTADEFSRIRRAVERNDYLPHSTEIPP